MNSLNLELKKSNKNYYIINIFFSIISIITALKIYFNPPTTGIYQYIYLLPFFFFLFNLVFYKIYSNITIVTAIVLIFMFIRYTISSIFLLMDGFPKGLYHINYSSAISIEATFLMILEMFFYFWRYILLVKKRKLK